MRRFFEMDSPMMRGLIRFTDLMILNLLTILCCIPIFTIGAAVSALYFAVGRMQRDEGHTFANYFEGLKTNFRKGTCLWLIMLPILALFVFALGYYTGGNLNAQLSSIGGIIVLIGLALWSMVLAWLFPLQSRFENTVKATLRNAAICALAFLWRTIVMTVLNLLPFVMLLLSPMSFSIFVAMGVVWGLFYFSTIASLNLRLLKKTFASLAPETVEEEDCDENEEEK